MMISALPGLGAGLVILGLVTGAPAWAAEDAAATVKAIYTLYLVKSTKPGSEPDQLDPKYYSARRRQQIKELEKACDGKDMCMPDADHFIDGQDYKITGLQVKALPAPNPATGTAKVEVRFRNFGTPSHMIFTMVKEGDRWVIDQLEGGRKDARYTLDTVLQPNF